MRNAFSDLLNQLENLYRQLNQSKIFKNDLNLTLVDLRVLEFIWTRFACNMKTIADDMYLAASTATGIIDRLDEKDLVTREHSKEDRRKVFLKLTPKGEKVLNEIRESVLVKMKKRLKNFTDKEIVAILELLKKLTITLEEHESDDKNIDNIKQETLVR